MSTYVQIHVLFLLVLSEKTSNIEKLVFMNFFYMKKFSVECKKVK